MTGLFKVLLPVALLCGAQAAQAVPQAAPCPATLQAQVAALQAQLAALQAQSAVQPDDPAGYQFTTGG